VLPVLVLVLLLAARAALTFLGLASHGSSSCTLLLWMHAVTHLDMSAVLWAYILLVLARCAASAGRTPRLWFSCVATSVSQSVS